MSATASHQGPDPRVITPSERATLDAMTGSLPTSVFYRLLTEPDGGEWSVVYASPTIERLFGITASHVEADAMSWYGMVHPDDQARALSEQAAAETTLTPFEQTLRFVLPNGRTRTFTMASSPERLADGCTVWNGVATDVTEARRVDEERQRLLDLIEATPDFVFVTRVDGQVEYANGAAIALGESVGKDPLAMTLFDLHTPETIEAFEREAFPALMRDGVWTGDASVVLTEDRVMPAEMVIVAHREEDGRVTHFSSIAHDMTRDREAAAALAEANEQVAVALREVNHRIKNFFALVPALVSLSARTAVDKDGLAEAVRERIGALSRSHTLTLNAFSEDHGVSIDALIRAVLEPYADTSESFVLDGPSIRLSGRIGNAVALALHELATNAAKHGVLSVSEGTVSITWRGPKTEGEPALILRWREEGGPPVSGPPTRKGFGTSLLDRLLTAQGGTIEREWLREGLSVRMTLPRT